MRVVFSPAKYNVNIAGAPITEFEKGDFVEVDYQENHNSVTIGSQGEHAFTESLDRSAVFTFRLQQSSPIHQLMSGLLAANIPVPIIVTDKNTNGQMAATDEALIQKPPAFIGGIEQKAKAWPFIAGRAAINHAGLKDM